MAGQPALAAEDVTESPHVVVAVRLRPLNDAELSEGNKKVVTPDGKKLVFSYKGQEHGFKFDHVLGDAANQLVVFEPLGKPQVEKAFDGYNSTIFAYGQTGSGKTFTMLNVRGLPQDIGLIPRISEALFKQLAETSRSKTTSRFLVQCSFLEIYNEVIYDLLVPRGRDSKGKGLEIREQKGLGVYVKDLTEEVVADAGQLNRLIHEGFAQRTTSATAMNDASSRSHCVFTICLHYQDTADSSRDTISKLHLVDLAGSEKSGSDERKQAKENANINKSLSALGNVINALSSAGTARRKAFVPYRDSKLTRVLQESFSGNAFCTMIATVSPAEVNSEETFSTLQYAKRAKTIRVAATRNQESKQREELQKEVEELRKLVLEASSTEELEARHKAEIEALDAFMKDTWEDKQRLSKEHEEQRETARKEVERANEQRLTEQQRRLDALRKLGDLGVTLQSFVALGTSRGECCRTWPERLASLLRIPQQLLSRHHGVRLYRDGAMADIRELLKQAAIQGSEGATSSLLLSQAAEKLKLMATEVPVLQETEKSYKGQLCAVRAEIGITLKEAQEAEQVDVEALALLQLVDTQLGHHYATTSEQFVNEVASLEMDLSQVVLRLESADDQLRGLATELRALEALPKVTSGELLPRPLGLASCDFPDEGLSASSNQQLAAAARLHQSLLTAGWCPATSSREEFLEVDLGHARGDAKVVTAFALQGRLPATGNWQQTRSLLQLVLADEALTGADARTFLRPPVRCVYEVAVALCKKVGWHHLQPAATDGVKDYSNLTKEQKLDFLSRLISETSALPKMGTVPGAVAGLESDDEVVQPLQLTAQDILAGRNCAETNRLLQLLACRALGLGEAAQWIGRWRLQYQVSGGDWQFYDGDFEGNSFEDKVHIIQLPKPLRADKLRIYPEEWHTRPALRLEVFVLEDELAPPEMCQLLEAHVSVLQRTLNEWKAHLEAGMRQHELAERKELAELGQLQRQLQEALAKVASSEAQLLQLNAENQRLQSLSESQRDEIAALSRDGLSHRQECERVSANLEDLQEQTAIICDERDVARKHEEELFYVIRRKDEELLRARAVLADLSQLVEEGQLADEAAELLGNVAGMEYDELYDRCSQLEAQNMELRAERERYEEAYKRCAQLEAEVAELRAERSRANRKREKLAEQKHELQEKLKLSEQLRQAARDRCEQILQQGQKRGSDSQGALEELARSMEDLAGTGTKPQRSLQRSRTVGAIGGSGAAAAEALSSMRAMGKQADSGFRPDDLSMGGAVLPVFGMPIEPLGDGSGPNTGRSGRSGRSVRSSVSGPAVAEAQPTSPSFGAKDETPSRASTSRHSRGKSPKPG